MIFRKRHLMIYCGPDPIFDAIWSFSAYAFRRPAPNQGELIFRIGFSFGWRRDPNTQKLVGWVRKYSFPAWVEAPGCSRPGGTYLAPSPIGRYGRTG